MKILTIYDGTIQSKMALQYGLRKAGEKSGQVLVLQVFPSGLFIDYDAGPQAEATARAEARRHRREAEELVAAAGTTVPVRFLEEEGDAVEESLRIVEKEKVELVLATPKYKSLVRKAGCPVYVMPGTIMLPIDAAEAPKADIQAVAAEAKATGSRVLLLGIVPVNLYSPAEEDELAEIRKKTSAAIRRIRKELAEQAVETDEALRSGYPDEEILKAAEEFSVSLILLPAGGKIPSEVAKAAAILLDEPGRVRQPLFILTPSAV